jgi:hypothetical protein
MEIDFYDSPEQIVEDYNNGKLSETYPILVEGIKTILTDKDNRIKTLESILFDLSDANFNYWEDIYGETGLPKERCKEIFAEIEVILKKGK